MVHGYKYDPSLPRSDPHRQIYAYAPQKTGKRIASWPFQLGLTPQTALAVGYGWPARGTIWEAHRAAGEAAHDLAGLIQKIRGISPQRPIHIVAHSLGARVTLAALSQCQANDVARVILITPAAFAREMHRTQQSAAGQTAEFFNIHARANFLFDALLMLALPHWGPPLGIARNEYENLVDLTIDRPQTLNGLNMAGFPMTEPARRICHWSGYLRQDICAVYRALIHRPHETPICYLRQLMRCDRSNCLNSTTPGAIVS
ncbi:alpha/beta fold hydrolase [Loktanella sp. S4079]|uniref:alpha/beta fold hydrolase n=1 Tax=Loktanella sp. S4079 TaxID=579483 RepID=UPI001EF67E29|nr:alpha/beta fold hydrolase [Loktanella sp. S4079]